MRRRSSLATKVRSIHHYDRTTDPITTGLRLKILDVMARGSRGRVYGRKQLRLAIYGEEMNIARWSARSGYRMRKAPGKIRSQAGAITRALRELGDWGYVVFGYSDTPSCRPGFAITDRGRKARSR